MKLRPVTDGDRDAVARVVREAFGDEGQLVAELVTALEAADKARHALVAEVDGEVVGHVQLNHSWLDTRRQLVDVLVLSPLSVLPAHQGNGIGRELLAAAVGTARASGCPALFLEGDPGFYGRHGFEPASNRGFVRPSTRIPEPAFQVVVLPTHEDWMTGGLIYCEPFWALDCVGLRDPLLAEVERNSVEVGRH